MESFFYFGVSWWSFTGVWVTARSSCLQVFFFSVFWPSLHLTSDFKSSFTIALGIIPSALITIGTTDTFLFYFLFSWKVKGLIFLFAFFSYSVALRDGKVHNSAGSLYYYYWCCFYYAFDKYSFTLPIYTHTHTHTHTHIYVYIYIYIYIYMCVCVCVCVCVFVYAWNWKPLRRMWHLVIF